MKIKCIISSIVVCILILLGGHVNAAIEASVTAEAAEVAKPGDKIEYKLKIKPDAVGSGIEGIMADIDYSKEMLELPVPESDEIIVMEGMLLVVLDEPIQAGEERTITLNFAVGSNATAGEAAIKLTNIILTDVDQTAKEDISDIETKIQIQQESGEPGQVPTEKMLRSIEVTTKPSKTAYTEGEKFDTTGIKITAKYSDGSSKEITEYTYNPDGELKTTDTKITISYTENGITKTVEQGITVIKDNDGNPNGEGTTGGTNTGKNEDKTTSEKEYPKTGAEIIIIPICLVITIAIASYVRYRKYKQI